MRQNRRVKYSQPDTSTRQATNASEAHFFTLVCHKWDSRAPAPVKVETESMISGPNVEALGLSVCDLPYDLAVYGDLVISETIGISRFSLDN